MLKLMILFIILGVVFRNMLYLTIHFHKLQNVITFLNILLDYQILQVYQVQYNLLILHLMKIVCIMAF